MRDINEISKAIEDGASRGIDMVMDILESDMRMNAPIRTGRLKASIETDKLDKLKSEVGSDLYYAGYADYHRPYVDKTVQSNEDVIVDVITDEIMRSINEL